MFEKCIRILFPTYKSKSELVNELNNERFINAQIGFNKIVMHERQVIPVMCRAGFVDGIPVEVINHHAAMELAKQIESFIEWEVIDGESSYNKVLVGKIYVSNRK